MENAIVERPDAVTGLAVPDPSWAADADIRRAVQHVLAWTVFVPDDRIHSSVSAGVVRLTGVVQSWAERAYVERAVRGLDVVRAVINELVVDPARIAEAAARKAIEAALERRAAREASRIEVAVFEGVATLRGTVHSWTERQAVVGAARGTAGVRRVEDRLQLTAT